MSVSSSLRSGSALGPGEGSPPGCACANRRGAPGLVAQRLAPREVGPGESNQEPAARSVLVVFADHAGCPWLRPLRRGFRHCFAVLRAGSVWLACDPLKDRIELDALHLPGDFDLAAFYREQGHRVLAGRRPPAPTRRRFAVAPLTCVTIVKRLLGIDAPWVWTPWQLYIHLSAQQSGFTTVRTGRGQNATTTSGANALLDRSCW